MHLCIRDIDFASFSGLIFDFGIIPTVWHFLFSFYNIISHIKCISFVSLFWTLYPFRSTEPLSNLIRYICAYKQYIICRDQTNRILHNHFLDRDASQRINVNSLCLLNIVYESQVICRLGYTTLQCESL